MLVIEYILKYICEYASYCLDIEYISKYTCEYANHYLDIEKVYSEIYL